jgi:hypothetical protein
MNLIPNKKLTLRQYFVLNKSTAKYCLKVSSIIFGAIATIITFLVELKTGSKESPLTVFIACELFGYSLAFLIFLLALIEGYTKARWTIDQFNNIDYRLKRQYSLELVKRPLNPKHWFMQFDIIQKIGDDYYTIDEDLKKQLIK